MAIGSAIERGSPEVDHVTPIRLAPERRLDPSNIQSLWSALSLAQNRERSAEPRMTEHCEKRRNHVYDDASRRRSQHARSC
jgi:hypothetical protein